MKIYNEDYIIEGGMEEKEFDFNNKQDKLLPIMSPAVGALHYMPYEITNLEPYTPAADI